MKITPELLTALGYTRDKIGNWYRSDVNFDCSIFECDTPDGIRNYGFGTKGIFISDVGTLLNAIFAAGVKEGQRRSADDFRRLIGLRGEG